MATIGTGLATALCNAVVDMIDLGGGPGYLRLLADSTTLANLTFNSTAFGAASGGVGGATAKLTTDAVCNSAAAAGTVSKAIINAKGNTAVFTNLSVVVSSGDLRMASLSIGAGDKLTLTTMTVTMPLSGA